MTERTRASWLVYVLGALCASAIAAAVLVVGPASGSQTARRRTATAQSGVVQSTVSGSGNIQAASQLNLGFRTSGTVTHIYITQGQQVVQGQLLATLDPQSAEVTLEQAKANLQSAEANLAKEQETDGEASTGQSSTGASGATAAAAYARRAGAVALATAAAAGPAPDSPDGPATTTTAPAAAAPVTTVPATTTPSKRTTATTPANSPSKPRTSATTPSSSTSEATSRETSPSSSKASVSTATREANLASARAAVKSGKLTVQSDEQAVQDTKLYAPEDGTIVSLSGQVGETVSGSGTTKASSASSSSSGSGSGAAGGAGGSAAGARSGSTSSSGSSSSSSSSGSGSSSSFAVLSDLNSMQLVVPLSESEVGNVKAGQIATVTVEALESSKLAAHVREVAILAASTSGAVSYDVTFQLDQMQEGLKPGMSATAEVVVKQAEGVNVPTTAISGGAVTVVENGKQVRRRVVTGLKGNSSTIILSGLKAGEKVLLPVATSTSSSSARGGAGLGRLGGLGGGGGLGGLGGGGAVLFRGGG
jgi:multidrug efflux pump subunit AcrA (membrane-fusion protein)